MKSIYDIYLDRRKNGNSKTVAVRYDSPMFGGPKIDGFDDVKQELSNAGFIICFITGDFELTNNAIMFMEESETQPKEENSGQVINIKDSSVTLKNSSIGNSNGPVDSSKQDTKWAKIGVIVAIVVGVATIITSVILWMFP